MAFGPCRGARIEPDGTVSVVGLFNRLVGFGPGVEADLDFRAIAILAGAVGTFDIFAQLMGPDGDEVWIDDVRLEFSDRHTLFAAQWHVRTRTMPGEYELRLLFNGGPTVVALPLMIVKEETR